MRSFYIEYSQDVKLRPMVAEVKESKLHPIAAELGRSILPPMVAEIEGATL
jgi:hypothetical protein